MGFLNELDKIRHELQQQFPGWQIWYVPSLDKSVTWCARPWPILNCGSVEHLKADIRQAHEEAASGWPALASLDDYAIHAPGIPQAESR
jgi:hypothetical protein